MVRGKYRVGRHLFVNDDEGEREQSISQEWVRGVVSQSRQREDKQSERGKEVSRDRSGEKKERENGKKGSSDQNEEERGRERERGKDEKLMGWDGY
jgi:hypothetical protein